MNKNLIIVMAGGFLIAVLVAFLVSSTLKGGEKKPVEEVVEAPPVSEIVVAAVEIKIGDELTPENTKWQEWPESGVVEGMIVREGEAEVVDVASGRVKRDIAMGEPIMGSALVKAGANYIAAVLGEGMRAIAVDVGATAMAGGFIGPGDYVDIMLLYRDRIEYNGPENPIMDDYIELNIDSHVVETILQNVKILAVDQTASRGGGEEGEDAGGPKVGRTVTLEVTLEQAEKLAVANDMGEIYLALRRLGDDKQYVRRHKIVTDSRITGIRHEINNELVELQKITGQNANIVRFYNGFTLEEVPVPE